MTTMASALRSPSTPAKTQGRLVFVGRQQAEKGDVHGRVDAASLGRSLHQVGSCYSSVGQFAEALPWFERAVATAEKGDVHGRVDAASLRTTREALNHALNALVKK